MTNDIHEAIVPMGNSTTDTYMTSISTTIALDPSTTAKKSSFVDHVKRPTDQPNKTPFNTSTTMHTSSGEIPTHNSKIDPTSSIAPPNLKILKLQLENEKIQEDLKKV